MSDESRLLLDDDAARAAALDISRSFIVQAPAGSGKTELLIQRYLKLLANVSAPEEVLAITFTRKAAAEMQVRVLRALQDAADGIEPLASHEKITAEAARAVLAADRNFRWNLLENSKRMRIQTLDSLNATIARKQPVTATGGAADTTIVADAEMRALYREAAALTLDQLAESGTFENAAREVLLHVDVNAGLYVAYLSRMLQTRDQWLPFVGSGLLDDGESISLRGYFEEGLQHAVTRQLALLHKNIAAEPAEELLKLGRYAARNLIAAGADNSSIAVLAEQETLPDGAPSALDAWLGVAELLLTGQGNYRKRLNKNQGFPAGDDEPKIAFRELVEALSEKAEFGELLHGVRSLPPLAYSDEQWQVLLALFHLLPLAVTELKRLFAERGIVDHIEVALSASVALGTPDAPGDVALLLDYQVRHLLVDEMQDTSAAQYRMIEALTGGWEPGDGRTLYCVGDPMQSIYRFRNAEVGQFLLSQEVGIGSIPLETLTLRRNFRSGAGLVGWFNDVFPGVLPRQDDPERSAVSYEAAASVPELSGLGSCHVYPVFGSDTSAEADLGLSVIRDTMAQFPNDDIAVLVRGRSHLPELLKRLRKNGIAYRAIEIDRLTDLPEIIDILALTRAIVHLGDRHAWLALLRSPWVGLTWSDIHAIVLNDTDSTVWDLIGDPAILERLSEFGSSAVKKFTESMHAILTSYRSETLRERIERAWMMLGGPVIPDDPDAIQNVYQYLDVVENLEVAGDLPDVAELEEALDAEHVSSSSSSRLHIMTMHRAKGLQFDHVMLYGLGRVPRRRESGVMSWFDLPDEHGQPLKVISPVGPRADLEKDPVHSYIGKIVAEMDNNEVGRLLYVACTRARKSLHLVGNARLFKSGMRPDKPSLLHLLWPVVRDDFENAFATDDSNRVERANDSWLTPRLRRIEAGWCQPTPPVLPTTSPDPPGDATPVDFYWVGAGARIAGTLVHRWLQYTAQGNLDLADLDESAVRKESGRWIREMGIAEVDSGPIIDRTVDSLTSMAADEKGRWLLSGDGHVELPLTGLVGSRTESLVLDRVRIDDAGVHWIVDYKTSSHEGGKLSSFLDAEVERYRPQLEKYAQLYRNYADVDIRCALYFPLLQEFIEVDVGLS